MGILESHIYPCIKNWYSLFSLQTVQMQIVYFHISLMNISHSFSIRLYNGKVKIHAVVFKGMALQKIAEVVSLQFSDFWKICKQKISSNKVNMNK